MANTLRLRKEDQGKAVETNDSLETNCTAYREDSARRFWMYASLLAVLNHHLIGLHKTKLLLDQALELHHKLGNR